MIDSSKCFGAQISDFLSKFETQFYSYSHVLISPQLFLPLSLFFSVIQSTPMGSIRRPSDYGGVSNEANDFIQCFDG